MTRINKYLADKGISTRKGADALISAGKVTINGRVAKLGDQVDDTDKVVVKGRHTDSFVYVAFNKPRGVITHSPQAGEQSITDVLPKELAGLKLFPVGRLDKDSHGLIILTNDGRITKRMLDPEFEHEKEYVVKTTKPLSPSDARKLARGVSIEGYQTKPARVHEIGPKTFSIVLTEGKKHQIRRMVAAIGNEVFDLKRTRVGTVMLGTMGSGRHRVLEGKELEKFLSSMKLPGT